MSLKKYEIRLNLPTVMWAILEIEAESEEEAIKKAFEQNAMGEVSYESSGFDHLDAELTSVEEVE